MQPTTHRTSEHIIQQRNARHPHVPRGDVDHRAVTSDVELLLFQCREDTDPQGLPEDQRIADVALPGSRGLPVSFLMYPNGETTEGRLDSLNPASFRYEIHSREIENA
jgi:hypothetical protein